MAHKKIHRKRRKAVGAFGNMGGMYAIGGMVAGYFLAGTVNPLIDSVIPSSIFPTPVATNPPTAPATGFAALGFNQDTVVGAAEIALGLALSTRAAGNSPGKIARRVGSGFAAGLGVHRLLKKTGIVSGYQSVPVIGRHRMAGYQSVPVIGKVPGQLAGPSQLEGFRVNGYNSQGSGVMGRVGGVYEGRGVAGAGNGSGSGITAEPGSECMY